MSHSKTLMVVGSIGLAGWLGCVSVDTPQTKVNVGLPKMDLPGGSNEDDSRPAYAKPLHKVREQQVKVAKYLAKRDWEEVVEKSSEWTEQIRELRDAASSSRDPQQFRQCCDELLVQAQAARQAAMRRDSVRAQQAFDACDPPLDRLGRVSHAMKSESPRSTSGNRSQRPQVP